VHSSVHPQNEFLANFLGHELDLPRPQALSNKFTSSLRAGREILLTRTQTTSPRVVPVEEKTLLELVVDMARPQLCSPAKSTSHAFRIVSSLWRIVTVGTGTPDLVWANPAARIPLRIQAFASLLHIIGAATIFMAKNGVRVVDGTKEWNVAEMGRVIALLFDERKLFGIHVNEISNASYQRPNVNSSPMRKKTHIRQNFELFGVQVPLATTSNAQMASSDLSSCNAQRKVVSIPSSSIDDSNFMLSTEVKQKKVDSKRDFLSALRAAPDDDFDRFEQAKANSEMLSSGPRLPSQPFDSLIANRRWKTLPSRSLSTIREADLGERDDPDVCEEEMKVHDVDSLLDTKSKISLDVATSVRQMRVPNIKKAATLNGDKFIHSTPVDVDVRPQCVVPNSDDEIERAGTAFLEVLGKSLKLK
jgi:hypothetical protein